VRVWKFVLYLKHHPIPAETQASAVYFSRRTLSSELRSGMLGKVDGPGVETTGMGFETRGTGHSTADLRLGSPGRLLGGCFFSGGGRRPDPRVAARRRAAPRLRLARPSAMVPHRMQRALLLSLVVLAVPPAGCEASRFGAALEQDSASSYRRFLALHREGDRAEEARRRLDRKIYEEAVRAGRPLGCHLYLREFPRGQGAAACRARLAGQALARARTPADLMLVIEQHPGTEEAGRAAERLPGLLAREALASTSAHRAQQFLDRYPEADEATRVRAHLAALRYPALADEPHALEGFATAFAGTPPASQALQRLERLLAEEVSVSGAADLFDQFRARFPDSSRLKELRRAVDARRLRRALTSLDLAALERLASGDDEPDDGPGAVARQVVGWCRSRARRCQSLAALGRRAASWQPGLTVEALRAKVYDPDLDVAWRAIASLGRLDESEAGALLLDLIGAERLSTVWMAERALRQWLERRGAERNAFTSVELRRAFREVNDDERQRRGALLLLVGQTAAAERLVAPLLSRPTRLLAASYLLLRSRRSPQATLLGQFVTASRGRLDWLKQAFPAEIHADSAVAAQLCEGELFSLERAVRAVVERGADGATGGAGSSGLFELQRLAGQLLARWRLQLEKARPGYRPAEEPGPDAAELLHQRGQETARRRLEADGSPVARLVLGAVCQGQSSPACRAIEPAYNGHRR